MLSPVEIGVLGATGPAGTGIAARLAAIGHNVVAGSRERSRADAVVATLREKWDARVDGLRAGTNDDAAAAQDLVIVATTWEGAVDTAAAHASALAGKVVASMANGLEKVGHEFRPVLPEAGSLAEAVQAAAPAARVASAFHMIPAATFGNLDEEMDSDVVVCSDDDVARDLVIDLVSSIPNLGAFDGGSLANSVGLEAFTAVLLTVNLRHKGSATLRLAGVDRRSPR
ncbi:MAG: NADPH-dependent F420 reductase [Actinobacteria bacterium]|nr:NADPH-dependent F420 reductase [Actinomycetota bacterium]